MDINVNVRIEAPELVNAINNLAKAWGVKELPANKPVPITNTASIPTVPVAPAPQYTIEQIMKAGAALMDEGKIEELRNLIKSFGVEAVTNLAPDQLGAFATELRKLGAKI